MMEANPHDCPGWRGLHGLVFLVVFGLLGGMAALRVWPLFMLAPLVAYAVLVSLVPPLRAAFQPWRFGRVTRPAVAATIVLALGSVAVLLIFERRIQPDLSGFAAVLPRSLAGSVLLLGVVFSIGNALIEEIIFRGILFDAAASQWGAWPAVAITTLLFGLAHLHGYPPGNVGTVLAAVFGYGLGALRVYTGGLGLAVIAHIAADATIFKILVDGGVFAG